MKEIQSAHPLLIHRTLGKGIQEMAPTRILHIVGSMNRAGAETMIMNLYRELDTSCVQFDFVCFEPGPYDFEQEIYELGGKILHISASNPLIRLYKTYSILKNGIWEIVHSHTLLSSGLHLSAAKFARIPKRISHSHSMSSERNSTRFGSMYATGMKFLLSYVATDYIACSEVAAQNLFPKKQDVKILHNAIDLEKFVYAMPANGKHIGFEDLPPLKILQVGRLVGVKNQKFSIKIAQALKEKGIDFIMMFVGNGPDYSELRAKIKEACLEDQVIMLGLRDDIPNLMAMSDIMLMPSLYEGFPVVLVESQAAGLPAIISDQVSKEVDLGLDLVRFESLTESHQRWASEIISFAKSTALPASRRHQEIASRGFSAEYGLEKILKVYFS